jgi:hypothetical protein
MVMFDEFEKEREAHERSVKKAELFALMDEIDEDEVFTDIHFWVIFNIYSFQC